MIKFLTMVPWRIAIGIVAAGVIYVSGALGLEVFESRIAGNIVHSPMSQMTKAEDKRLHNDITYQLAVTAEESLEMNGVILYLSVVLAYLAETGASLEVQFPGRSTANGETRLAMVKTDAPCPSHGDGLS